MIQLYLSLTGKLAEIKELKLVDIAGTNEGKIFPAAFVNLAPLNYEQLHQGAGIAQVPITVQVELNPVHRSGSNSPMLDALTASFNVIESVKSKLLKEEVECISGIMLSGEDLKKENGKYLVTLNFVGTVEYVPD
ncbi:MAG: hypothetical protein N4A74_21525 [Carboxylicivirga sp.]|jgi:hypothetical protein|nr:hypothetical protein [Carboxylicivirga sp.]